MSGHDSKYFSTTKKGEIPELKEELNSQYKVRPPSFSFPSFYISITLFKQMLFYDLDLWYEAIRVSISICLIRSVYIWLRFIVWTVWFRWIFCRNYNFIGGSSYIYFLFFLRRNRRELVHRTQIEVVFPLVCFFLFVGIRENWHGALRDRSCDATSPFWIWSDGWNLFYGFDVWHYGF